MKVYGETVFDIVYLVTAVAIGIYILLRGKDKCSRLMGVAALILGCGDAFHLVPRMLNYFIDSDFSSALGVGKLITSVTMTVFYICLYYIYLRAYGVVEDKKMSACVWGLSAMRIVLCLMPQNRWLTNDGPLMWGIIRNIPFAVLGAVIVALYFGVRKEVRAFQNVWLYVTLSFLFYFPVVVGAGAVPILGMFMLPKTVCYMLILFAFKNKTKGEAEK